LSLFSRNARIAVRGAGVFLLEPADCSDTPTVGKRPAVLGDGRMLAVTENTGGLRRTYMSLLGRINPHSSLLAA
jgi:hypothetical protein